MSDTPRTDAACNIYDLQIVAEDIERELNAANAIIRQQQLLEQENDASNAEIERLTNKVAQLYRGAEEQNQRIKQLEEENDAMRADLLLWNEQEAK